ncbi:uncharacterized protein BO97DRAFT_425489 [Aspergillus homomorphus CBS 101889]|uniref:Uncharacterized protein n=1 Tax=Aspergillus homomorphus (strain CBS 101889) TaxID=1450537 RepID=A0A395HU81_ASPHC|nr:hypothetical protein BO97DRAFT_425489 [Aspergillus homomorphus CBS 101889]RAL11492.1 hypothetical protein BO97DRAFT_425489 [Aspergillus homomorphus CBS 101889]
MNGIVVQLQRPVAWCYRHPAQAALVLLGGGALTLTFAALATERCKAGWYPLMKVAACADPAMTNPCIQCWGQERTAMVLSMFLGWGAADHWYAHHWALATLKTLPLLTMIGSPILWVFLNVHTSPGPEKQWLLALLVLTNVSAIVVKLWWFVDTIIWMNGGYYGTPGCQAGHGLWDLFGL